MTVKELIKKLEQCPQDAILENFCDNCDVMCAEVETIFSDDFGDYPVVVFSRQKNIKNWVKEG